MEGYLCAHFKVFEQLSGFFKNKRMLLLSACLSFVVCFVARYAFNYLPGMTHGKCWIDIILIIPFVFGTMTLIDEINTHKMFAWIGKTLSFFGKHSLYMWLTHAIFVRVVSQKLAGINQSPIVTYAYIMLFALLSSMLLIKIETYMPFIRRRKR